MTITPVGASDARAARHWAAGWNDRWVDQGSSTTLSADYDPSDSWGRWWYVPVFEFPISPVSGAEGLDATLHVYVEGVGGPGVQLRFCGADDNGVIESADWMNAGTPLITLSAGTSGWAPAPKPFLRRLFASTENMV